MTFTPSGMEGRRQKAPLRFETAISGGKGQVLIVSRSRINLVVVTEIVNRCGLRALPESIEGAMSGLHANQPKVVVLDGGADNLDCHFLFEHIAALRRSSETGLPRVIMLCKRNGTAESLSLPPLIDEVVAKPITPERLQPVIERLAQG